MNTQPFRTSLILIAIQAACSAPAAFAEDMPSLPQVQVVQYVFNCAAPRSLPSQREVGEWTGQHNFSQIYQTRQKLMAEVARACHREGIEQVHLVCEQPATNQSAERQIARIEIPRHQLQR